MKLSCRWDEDQDGLKTAEPSFAILRLPQAGEFHIHLWTEPNPTVRPLTAQWDGRSCSFPTDNTSGSSATNTIHSKTLLPVGHWDGSATVVPPSCSHSDPIILIPPAGEFQKNLAAGMVYRPPASWAAVASFLRGSSIVALAKRLACASCSYKPAAETPGPVSSGSRRYRVPEKDWFRPTGSRQGRARISEAAPPRRTG